jgi:amino acid adenylation domain-containing protein/non-ribosomal peptide synthase protein (TIGR01720 family)
LRTLLAGVVADSRQRLSELPLLDEQEQQQMLVEWNRTQAEFPNANRTLSELFEAQAESTPDQIALTFADEKLTYRELNERANRVGHYLLRQGVKTETLVGVMLERSIDLIVAVIGISKAGGAYVPLDPNYPVERLSFILEDTGAPLLITKERLANLVPTTAKVIQLDVEAEQISQESRENPPPAASSDHLVYVIYTSGSTGTPKGTLITHGGLVNYLIWAIEAYPVAEGNGSPFHTSLSFDLTLTNIYPALLAGRPVEIVPETEGVSGLVAALLRKPNYSLIKLTPAHCQLVGNDLAEQPAPPEQLSVSLVIGGENLLAEQAKWWREAQPQIRLFNEYGPTETVVGCCIYEVQPETEWTGSVPIGKPIANTQHYILDAKAQPAPVGIAGELYIGGAGVARGYLNRPGLTAERFVPDPFSGAPGSRMYRTGDEARYRADGVIEYLGRLDQQVKLRGFRIELGEIEAVLCQHPNVREAVVVVRGEAEEKRLFAYVCGELESAATELRNFLKQYLPEYMVPAVFIVLDKMPLSNSGKVDRKRLPEPETSRPSLAETYVAPRTEVERVLVKIWSDVLSVTQVGIHDNFFELGGDSILSVQIGARAHQAGLPLTAQEVFYHQTIAGLAAVAESALQLSATAHEEVTGPVELMPIQHWFFEQELPEPNHFNISVMVSAGNDMNMNALRGSLAAMLRHHDALRMRYKKLSDGAWQQRYAPVAEVEVSLEVVDLNAVPVEELHDAILKTAADSQGTLNLEQGPLFKAVYIDLGADRGARLLLVVHHLVMDIISWRILFEDLQTTYKQITNGEAVQLRAKSTSYQQWAAQLKAYAATTEPGQEIGYWTDERRRQIQPLPVDHHGRNLESTIKYANSKLSKELTEALLREVPRVYHTQINEVLLAALAGIYQQWTGERYLIVDVEGHGREALREEVLLTRTIGWFTSIYPLLLEVEAGSDSGERLKGIKEQVRKVKNGGIGYGVLRYLSADEAVRRQLREQPQAEISFNYLGQHDQAASEVKEAGLFRAATEGVGPVRAAQGDRRYKLQVSSSVMGGELYMSWEYSTAVHREETVAQLAAEYLRELERLIRHCQNANAGAFTPSDFAEFKWSESDLEDISAAIAKARGAA